MKIIGITGGVGAGKTQVLSYIEAHYRCRIIRADEAAHQLYEPGQACYQKLVALLGQEVLNADGTIHKAEMAKRIFHDEALLERVNSIVHPEEQYDQIVDEMWYVHSDAAVRRQRLAQSRQYSEQKTADIMRGQLSEAAFRAHCQVVITNNGDLEETYKQVRDIMGD